MVTVIELLQTCWWFLVILPTIGLHSLQLPPNETKTSACPEKVKFVIVMIEMPLTPIVVWNNFQKLLLDLESQKKPQSQSFQFWLKFTSDETKELVCKYLCHWFMLTLFVLTTSWSLKPQRTKGPKLVGVPPTYLWPMYNQTFTPQVSPVMLSCTKSIMVTNKPYFLLGIPF